MGPRGSRSPQTSNYPNRWDDDEILQRLIELNPIDPNPIDPSAKRSDKIIISKELHLQVDRVRLLRIAGELQTMRAGRHARESVNVVALRLSARGHPGLFDYILKVGEFSVGNAHRALRLLDFGAESLVFLGEDLRGVAVAIKIPFLDFTNLAHLDVDQLLRRRRRLAHEATMLRALPETALPAFVAEHVGRNPLFPPRMPPFLRDAEQCLVTEYVNGERIDTLARSLHQQGRGCCSLRLAAAFAATFFDLSEVIANRLGPEAVYTDIKPENALLQDSEIRIVDASSILPSSLIGDPRSLSVSALYLDPIDHRQWTAGKFVPNPAFIVRSVVRAVHSLVADAPLFVGQASPSWPPGALIDLGPALDALVTDLKIDLRHAADISHALVERLACEHGSDAICNTSGTK